MTTETFVEFKFVEDAESNPITRSVVVNFNYDEEAVTWMDLTERYVEFLRGVGYVVKDEDVYEMVGGRLGDCCKSERKRQAANIPAGCSACQSCADGEFDTAPRDYTGDLISRDGRWEFR